eukprot:scaffold1090_cov265-Pinguiococcus_pyrenoidosus.AAC.8
MLSTCGRLLAISMPPAEEVPGFCSRARTFALGKGDGEPEERLTSEGDDCAPYANLAKSIEAPLQDPFFVFLSSRT